MTLPTRTAREIPTFGSYGLPLEMSFRMVLWLTYLTEKLPDKIAPGQLADWDLDSETLRVTAAGVVVRHQCSVSVI